MKVDMNMLLTDEEYTPQVGAEYEVAPGKWGKLLPPTIERQEAVFAKTKEDDAEDFVIMKMVLSGVDDVEKENTIFGMPTRAVQDFFTLLEKMSKRLMNRYKESAPSPEAERKESPES